MDVESVTLEDIEANIARCPDAETAQKMIDRIDDIRKRGDSVGGTYHDSQKHDAIGLWKVRGMA